MIECLIPPIDSISLPHHLFIFTAPKSPSILKHPNLPNCTESDPIPLPYLTYPPKKNTKIITTCSPRSQLHPPTERDTNVTSPSHLSRISLNYKIIFVALIVHKVGEHPRQRVQLPHYNSQKPDIFTYLQDTIFLYSIINYVRTRLF